MKRIQSKLLKNGTYKVCKNSLSCFGDKRHILDDDINSLAYFIEIYWKINLIKLKFKYLCIID